MDAMSLDAIRPYADCEELPQRFADETEADASNVDGSIAGIEAGHAAVRRLIHARSNQTHQLQTEDANAEWIATKCRLPSQQTKRQRKMTRSKFYRSRRTVLEDR